MCHKKFIKETIGIFFQYICILIQSPIRESFGKAVREVPKKLSFLKIIRKIFMISQKFVILYFTVT